MSLCSKQYLQTYYSSLEIDLFRERFFNDFFQKYNSKWDRNSARLLDFSAGAVIMNYVSSAPYVTEIVHAAYTEDERKEIELWRNNAEGTYNWNPFIKQVVNLVEGLEGDIAWQERVALLCSKIRVISCNIKEDPPINIIEETKFSIICTSFTFEVTSKSFDDLKAGVKKLVKLLRFGGYLVIVLDEDESYYVLGETKHPMLPISMGQLQEAVEEAGCVVLMSERETTPIHLMENPTVTDEKASVCLVAYKVKNIVT